MIIEIWLENLKMIDQVCVFGIQEVEVRELLKGLDQFGVYSFS